MRIKKKYTVKEWKKLKDIQEILCQKFDVILTDHKTRKETIMDIFEKINLKNFNKGMESFNKIIQDFGGSMEQLTSELNPSPKNNVKIWSDLANDESQKGKNNLKKIWGDKFEV
jgi:hypothetical protein